MAEHRITRRMLLEQIAQGRRLRRARPDRRGLLERGAPRRRRPRRPSPRRRRVAADRRADGDARRRPPTPEPTPVPTPESELHHLQLGRLHRRETSSRTFEEKYGIKVKYDMFPDASTQIDQDPERRQGRRLRHHLPGLDRRPAARPRRRDPAARPVADPEHHQPRTRLAEPGLRPGQPALGARTVVDDRGRLGHGQGQGDVDQLEGALGRAYKGKHRRCSTTSRRSSRPALIPARASRRTRLGRRAARRRSWPCSRQQKPLLRKYTEDDIGDLTSGQLWMTQAWSGDWVQMTYEKPKVAVLHPEEGAIRGSDTMVVLVRRQAPDRGPPVHQLQPRRQGQRANSNYIGYMGPNAAAKAVHRPGHPANPNLNPDEASSTSCQELLDLEGAASTSTRQRWIELTT